MRRRALLSMQGLPPTLTRPTRLHGQAPKQASAAASQPRPQTRQRAARPAALHACMRVRRCRNGRRARPRGACCSAAAVHGGLTPRLLTREQLSERPVGAALRRLLQPYAESCTGDSRCAGSPARSWRSGRCGRWRPRRRTCCGAAPCGWWPATRWTRTCWRRPGRLTPSTSAPPRRPRTWRAPRSRAVRLYNCMHQPARPLRGRLAGSRCRQNAACPAYVAGCSKWGVLQF
jgi:hypothetical protein